MATKTRKIKKGEMTEDQKQGVIEKAKQTAAALEKNLAIYENDLKRNAETLCNAFGVKTIEEALKKVEELNGKLPALQSERDNIIVKIQDYMTANNL